ncbi:MAG: zinc-binding dehydrogenase [Clostridia bacterium]|nr:zinc-binding dehydrogenase [Clostridia bacterium]
MIGWHVPEFGKIEKTPHHEPLEGLDSVKIKLTHALITEDDVSLICGEDKSVKTPFIPGRFGVGQISEVAQESAFLKKGDRVFISAVEPCGRCSSCEGGKPDNCYNFNVAGKTVNGFLKDFATTNLSNVFALPKNVKDEDAVYIEYVALALSVIDKLNVKKSTHVAIIGGNVFGSILAQVLIYYQAVPIIIDDDSESLKHAKKSGIYYTAASNSRPEKEVSSITGGRMASNVVYVARSGLNTDLAYKLAAHNAPIVFAGFSYPNLRIPMNIAMAKQLDTFCINNGYGNYLSAINLLANKAVDLSSYSLKKTSMPDLVEAIEKQIVKFNKKEHVDNLLIDLLG